MPRRPTADGARWPSPPRRAPAHQRTRRRCRTRPRPVAPERRPAGQTFSTAHHTVTVSPLFALGLQRSCGFSSLPSDPNSVSARPTLGGIPTVQSAHRQSAGSRPSSKTNNKRSPWAAGPRLRPQVHYGGLPRTWGIVGSMTANVCWYCAAGPLPLSAARPFAGVAAGPWPGLSSRGRSPRFLASLGAAVLSVFRGCGFGVASRSAS